MTSKPITPGPEHIPNLVNAMNLYLIPALQKSPKPSTEQQKKPTA